ncbi:MAG: endonuclease/exonuclease/phosphatase family protein, partial [Muribaculaceae bacterium]
MTCQAVHGSNYENNEYKIISFNVRYSSAPEIDGDNRWELRRDASVKMVAKHKPLVMGLQEACPDQIDFLDLNLTGYKHIGVGRDDGKRAGEMMAIYYDTTRLTLLDSGTFWLSETPEKVSIGWDAACNRTCTWGHFKVNDTGFEFLYFNTHLDHLGSQARKNSIRLIVDKMTELNPDNVPVFLSGDFNSTTDDPIFDPLKASLKDARMMSAISDKNITYNGFGKVTDNPDARKEWVIDHIFFSGVNPLAFRVLNCNFGVPFISDHYPISF